MLHEVQTSFVTDNARALLTEAGVTLPLHLRLDITNRVRDLTTAQAEMTVHIRKSQSQANKLTLQQLFNNTNTIHFD